MKNYILIRNSDEFIKAYLCYNCIRTVDACFCNHGILTKTDIDKSINLKASAFIDDLLLRNSNRKRSIAVYLNYITNLYYKTIKLRKAVLYGKNPTYDTSYDFFVGFYDNTKNFWSEHINCYPFCEIKIADDISVFEKLKTVIL